MYAVYRGICVPQNYVSMKQPFEVEKEIQTQGLNSAHNITHWSSHPW